MVKLNLNTQASSMAKKDYLNTSFWLFLFRNLMILLISPRFLLKVSTVKFQGIDKIYEETEYKFKYNLLNIFIIQ